MSMSDDTPQATTTEDQLIAQRRAKLGEFQVAAGMGNIPGAGGKTGTQLLGSLFTNSGTPIVIDFGISIDMDAIIREMFKTPQAPPQAPPQVPLVK